MYRGGERVCEPLEEELGTRLLHRTTRTVSLTLVRAGYGCSILPQMNFISSDIRIIPITGNEPLSYGIFFRKNAVSPLLKKFISIMTTTSFQ